MAPYLPRVGRGLGDGMSGPRFIGTGRYLGTQVLDYTAHLLHPTRGFLPSMDVGLPSMDSRLFHGWYIPWGYPTIHLIAAIIPPMGLPSMDGDPIYG